jgi:hypothetical protein
MNAIKLYGLIKKLRKECLYPESYLHHTSKLDPFDNRRQFLERMWYFQYPIGRGDITYKLERLGWNKAEIEKWVIE